MKKVCTTTIVIAILILCLCGCGNTALDINGTCKLETISNEEGKLLHISLDNGKIFDITCGEKKITMKRLE